MGKATEIHAYQMLATPSGLLAVLHDYRTFQVVVDVFTRQVVFNCHRLSPYRVDRSGCGRPSVHRPMVRYSPFRFLRPTESATKSATSPIPASLSVSSRSRTNTFPCRCRRTASTSRSSLGTEGSRASTLRSPP